MVLENTELRFTTSIGTSQWRPGEDTIKPVLQRADDALYQAKRAGRNKVVVA